MAEDLKKHPMLAYVTFVLPMALLAIGAAISASLILIILTIAWLGAAFMILFLPIEAESSKS
jgi:hypothetical protein